MVEEKLYRQQEEAPPKEHCNLTEIRETGGSSQEVKLSILRVHHSHAAPVKFSKDVSTISFALETS